MANIPVETPNEPAAAAMRDFLGIIPIEDLPAVVSIDGTEKVAVLEGAVPGFMTTQEIADLVGGGATAPLTLDGGTATTEVGTTPLTIEQTWDDASHALEFIGLALNMTIPVYGSGKPIRVTKNGGVIFDVDSYGGVKGTVFEASIGARMSFDGNFSSRSDGMFRWATSTDANAVIDTGLARNAAGVVEVNNSTAGQLRDLKLRDILMSPSASLTPAANGDLVIEKTSDTTLTFKLKGSDGTVRSATLTLA